jgi:putative hydrolase of the HAD superfamily
MIRAVIFDFGHTIMDELQFRDLPLRTRPVCLMPGVLEALPRIAISKGIWANTKRTKEAGVWHWLRRARIDHYFKWVTTSVDAGCRKPDKRFFAFALKQTGLRKLDVLFVGNQLNTDIRGAAEYGIQNVWLSGAEYNSPDDTMAPCQITPDHIISSLHGLHALLAKLNAS